MKTSRGFASLLILAIIAILIIGGGAYYFKVQYSAPTLSTASSTVADGASSITITSPIEGGALSANRPAKIAWNISPAFLDSIPKDFKVYVMLYARKQGNDMRNYSIGDGWDPRAGSATWDIPSYISHGELDVPGTYQIFAQLQANSPNPCAQSIGKDCAPSDADAAVIARVATASTTTGWFTISSTAPETISDFSASPLSGVSPLTVGFTIAHLGSGPFTLDFGDGEINYAPTSSLSHTYQSAGIYTAKLYAGKILENDGPKATVTITIASAGGASATIDQGSLVTTSGTPTITGTASGLSQVVVDVYGGGNGFYGWTQVVGGKWSFTISPANSNVNNDSTYLSPATYGVTVDSDKSVNADVLTEGTLTVR
jgi:PKD repeat protein